MKLWLATLVALVCGLSCAQESKRSVMVYAATSLEDVLREAASLWSEESDVSLRFNFAGSNELTRQLLAGARAEILFSANTEEMTRLVDAQFVDPDATHDFLSNRMVLIARRDAHLDFDAEHSIALAEESVPQGRYAREWMKERDGSALLGGKLRRISTLNARATLGAVESGATQLGCVYYSDAISSDLVVILEDQGPGELPQILYPVAVLRDAELAEEARSFVSFLQSRRELFERHGFRYRP